MKRVILFAIFFVIITLSGCTSAENELPESDSSILSKYESTQEEIITTTEEERKSPAEEILDSMSLEEKIGQVILARYPDNAAEMAEKYHFGGYTLYAKDIENETPESLSAKLDGVRANTKLPPFIAADEEGGEIVRISKYAAFAEEPLPSVQEALAAGTSMEDFTAEMSEVLKKAGVNLNLAPVADVAESQEDYIYSRTCGLDYEGTAQTVEEIVRGMKKRGIMCCLKHFPGYGSNVDTHTGIAVDEREKSDFEEKDFLPFKAGTEAGAPMVMVNHNIVTAYNSEMPASLAPEIHKALRELGFGGIIITDDLGMDAISDYTDSPYVTAFLAGNDMLCATDSEACFEALSEAVSDGRITEERLNESVLRIIGAKIEYGIIG